MLTPPLSLQVDACEAINLLVSCQALAPDLVWAPRGKFSSQCAPMFVSPPRVPLLCLAGDGSVRDPCDSALYPLSTHLDVQYEGGAWETWELGMEIKNSTLQTLVLVYLYIKGGTSTSDPISYWGSFYNMDRGDWVEVDLQTRRPPRDCRVTPTYNVPIEVFDDDLKCKSSFLSDACERLILAHPTGRCGQQARVQGLRHLHSTGQLQHPCGSPQRLTTGVGAHARSCGRLHHQCGAGEELGAGAPTWYSSLQHPHTDGVCTAPIAVLDHWRFAHG